MMDNAESMKWFGAGTLYGLAVGITCSALYVMIAMIIEMRAI